MTREEETKEAYKDYDEKIIELEDKINQLEIRKRLRL